MLEMISNFYAHMIFDTRNVAEDYATPALRSVPDSSIYREIYGQDIEWSATVITMGSCTENTIVNALWMVGKFAGNKDVLLAC